MLLSIDIGNSMVTLGVFNGEQLVTILRLTSDTRRLDDEYGLLVTNLLNLNGVATSATAWSPWACSTVNSWLLFCG